MADPFKVDFFIVGFPKCGTTSLAPYLGQHPNICFSDPKEPYYFTDIEYDKGIKTLSDYKNIFKEDREHKKLGEGTVATIYSLKALHSEIAKQGKYIKQLFSLVNPKNCHLIFFEELQINPRLCYLNMLNFLDLDDDGLNNFNVKNKNQVFRTGMLGSLGKILLAFIRHPRWIRWRNKILVSNMHIEEIVCLLCQESRKRTSIDQSTKEKII